MESKNLLVHNIELHNIELHMSPSVIKAMAAFVYLAVVKDIIVGMVKYWWYREGMDLK